VNKAEAASWKAVRHATRRRAERAGLPLRVRKAEFPVPRAEAALDAVRCLAAPCSVEACPAGRRREARHREARCPPAAVAVAVPGGDLARAAAVAAEVVRLARVRAVAAEGHGAAVAAVERKTTPRRRALRVPLRWLAATATLCHTVVLSNKWLSLQRGQAILAARPLIAGRLRGFVQSWLQRPKTKPTMA
jgi:hypothetical protein